MNKCKLTICFEEPFWVGLVETEDEEVYNIARHVFGSEPTDPEVLEFIRTEWNSLRFTVDLHIEKRVGRKMNYKRMRRIIEKEIAANARRGTRAQQAIAEQREANKAEREVRSKTQREAEVQERFDKRTEKRKQKRRGH